MEIGMSGWEIFIFVITLCAIAIFYIEYINPKLRYNDLKKNNRLPKVNDRWVKISNADLLKILEIKNNIVKFENITKGEVKYQLI